MKETGPLQEPSSQLLPLVTSAETIYVNRKDKNHGIVSGKITGPKPDKDGKYFDFSNNELLKEHLIQKTESLGELLGESKEKIGVMKDKIKNLIENDSDVLTRYRESMLKVHSSRGNEGIVKSLLKCNDVDPNKKSPSGKTCLHKAASKGNRATVLALIEGGADINHLDSEGNSAIISAASKDNSDSLKALLEYDEELNFENSNLHKAFQQACSTASTKAMDVLFNNDNSVLIPDINGSDAVKSTLEIKGKGKLAKTIGFLKDKGVNINEEDSLGNTALLEAVNQSNINAAKCLLSAGADPYHKNIFGESALDYNNDPAITNALTEHIDKVSERKSLLEKSSINPTDFQTVLRSCFVKN